MIPRKLYDIPIPGIYWYEMPLSSCSSVRLYGRIRAAFVVLHELETIYGHQPTRRETFLLLLLCAVCVPHARVFTVAALTLL